MGELTHLRHFQDGYPLCWPMDQDGEFAGTFDEAQVTCPVCQAILSEDPGPGPVH